MTAQGNTRGRPPAASREMLQDAAFELFLENGYAGTTVEHIAQRAGVSRNTFFNYFDGKGEVFWVELDECIRALSAELERPAGDAAPLSAVRDAVVTASAALDASRVPFALTQHKLIGSTHELQASALGRFTAQARLLREVLSDNGFDAGLARSASYALLGAVIAAAQEWADAGTGRGELAPFITRATDPLVAGFEPG